MFEERGIVSAASENRDALRRLLEWAKGLEAPGLARPGSDVGSEKYTLLVHTAQKGHGSLVFVYHTGRSFLGNRHTFEELAAGSLGRVEVLTGKRVVGQQNGTVAQIEHIDGALLDALAAAYAEATRS